MRKISPCLWFDTEAEEAARFYTSIFPNSSIGRIAYYGDYAPSKAGTVLTVEFELDGERFCALNGGPLFQFNEAVSLMIDCETQTEVDYYWEKLLAGGGVEQQCGWLKDRFGVSWQVVPRMMLELADDRDKERVDRVMSAMMQMVKLDIAQLEAARAA